MSRVPWIGFHTFRHTCASMLIEQGKNPRQVAAWLGHADPAFTLRTYCHRMDEGLGAPLQVPPVRGQQSGNTPGANDGSHRKTIEPESPKKLAV